MAGALSGTLDGPRPPTLGAALRVLATARWRMAWNDLRFGSPGHRLGVLALLSIVVAAGYGLFWLTSTVLAALTGPSAARILARLNRELPADQQLPDLMPLILALPTLALTIAMLLLLLTSFSEALTSLYLTGDLDLLLVAPVPRRAVFLVKLVSGLLGSYVFLLVLLGPAIVGYGRGLGFGPAYYLVALMVLLCLPLLPVSLATLLVMMVVRVMPARRARTLVSILGALTGVLGYAASQFSSRVLLVIGSGETLERVVRLDGLPLPSAWAGQALIAAGHGEWPIVLVVGGSFVLISIAALALCLLLAEYLYVLGWAEEGTSRRAATAAATAARLAAQPAGPDGLLRRLLPAPVAAIVAKDLRVMPRDLRHLQNFIFPVGMAIIWVIQLIGGGRAPATGRAGGLLNSAVGLGTAGIAFFLCLSLSSALAGSGIGREGQHLWLLKVAPLSARRLLLGKLVVAYLPFPIIGLVMTGGLAALGQLQLGEAVQSLLFLLVVGLGTTTLSLGLGAAFPQLDSQNPQRQISTRASCLGRLIYPLYLGLAALLVYGLPVLGFWFPAWAIWLTLVGWLLVLASTSAVIWGALLFGARRFDRLELT